MPAALLERNENLFKLPGMLYQTVQFLNPLRRGEPVRSLDDPSVVIRYHLHLEMQSNINGQTTTPPCTGKNKERTLVPPGKEETSFGYTPILSNMVPTDHFLPATGKGRCGVFKNLIANYEGAGILLTCGALTPRAAPAGVWQLKLVRKMTSTLIPKSPSPRGCWRPCLKRLHI